MMNGGLLCVVIPEVVVRDPAVSLTSGSQSDGSYQDIFNQPSSQANAKHSSPVQRRVIFLRETKHFLDDGRLHRAALPVVLEILLQK